jgi:hypothetical protein
MKARRAMQVFAILVAAGVFGGCTKQARSGIDIDPRADETLRKMSATVGGAKSFSFRSVVTMDEPVDTGQLAQFTRENRIIVCRPDRLRAEARQGDDALFLWYEDETLTIFDKASNVYAVLEVPNRIDAMLDDIALKHGLTLPLADLLFSDPYRVLTADVLMGRYAGLDEVGGVKCHHLLFTQETIDWQIWIDAGEKPVPRRFVMDYKSLPGRPEFSAVLSDWNLAASGGEQLFRPAVTTDAEKVELRKPFAATAQGE